MLERLLPSSVHFGGVRFPGPRLCRNDLQRYEFWHGPSCPSLLTNFHGAHVLGEFFSLLVQLP
jgi:hypothetical protein